ncbi:MAG: hypothetical protein Q9163_005796, partial [Psora crenata]
ALPHRTRIRTKKPSCQSRCANPIHSASSAKGATVVSPPNKQLRIEEASDLWPPTTDLRALQVQWLDAGAPAALTAHVWSDANTTALTPNAGRLEIEASRGTKALCDTILQEDILDRPIFSVFET